MKLTYNKYNHIPLETNIGGGVRIPHLLGIVLSGKASIGEQCTIMHQVTIGVDESKENRISGGILWLTIFKTEICSGTRYEK